MSFGTESIQYIVFLVLIKLTLVVIVAAMLANFDYFSRMLFHSSKSLATRFKLSIIICATLIICLTLRYSAKYHALDFSIIGLFVTGVVAGLVPALCSTAIVSTILVIKGEYWLAVMCFLSAVSGTFFYKRNIFEGKKRLLKLSLGILPIVAAFYALYRYFPEKSFFILSNKTIEGDITAGLSEVLGVFLTFFLWKYYRTKLELIENEFHLNKSRLAVLSSKINPHFLFNTLNTIAAAIRIDPKIAREIVFKLSEIMRYILNSENEFKPVQDELNFIQNYLSIETMRFGEDRLKVFIETDNEAREEDIPTMLIQPVVENAVKHGIAPLTDRHGEIKIKTYKQVLDDGEYLVVDVIDNGVGMVVNESRMFERGIGLANVRDRLMLLYGKKGIISFFSSLGSGTTVTIKMPLVR
jgi:two-component system LytT family sensor kinase